MIFVGMIKSSKKEPPIFLMVVDFQGQFRKAKFCDLRFFAKKEKSGHKKNPVQQKSWLVNPQCWTP